MLQPQNCRLTVSLRDGAYAQTATMDFRYRETLESQLGQLSIKVSVKDWAKLFEFKNESGELLAFRATTYVSYAVTAVDGIGLDSALFVSNHTDGTVSKRFNRLLLPALGGTCDLGISSRSSAPRRLRRDEPTA
jgi:hypothetical protein